MYTHLFINVVSKASRALEFFALWNCNSCMFGVDVCRVFLIRCGKQSRPISCYIIQSPSPIFIIFHSQIPSIFLPFGRSVFLRGFRGDSQCNDISIQFCPCRWRLPPLASLRGRRHMRFSQTNRHFTIFFLFQS
jgi:hypothetical protein